MEFHNTACCHSIQIARVVENRKQGEEKKNHWIIESKSQTGYSERSPICMIYDFNESNGVDSSDNQQIFRNGL